MLSSPVHLLLINDFALVHFLVEHRHQGGHSVRQFQRDEFALNERPEDLQEFEDGLGDEAVVEGTPKHRPQLPVQLKGATLEVLVVADERLVHRIQAVVGAIGKHAVQLLL